MHSTLLQLRRIFLPHKSRREFFVRELMRRFSALRSRQGREYRAWMALNEPDAAALAAQKKLAAAMPERPQIRLFLPVGAQTEAQLRQTILSVQAQTYPDWELYLAGENTAMQTALKDFTAQDGRIRVVPEGTIPAARARGTWTGFIDPDGCLAPFALFELVQALQTCPQTDLFYSDEDTLSADGGRRSDPYFKPAFGMDNLRAADMMSHFLVLRTALGEELGWLRPGLEGAQVYDLALRAVEKTGCVTHIPRVLLHHRESPADPRAAGASLRAVREHLSRCGLRAGVEPGPAPATQRLDYALTGSPLVSIIIPNHEHVEELRRCVNSILDKSTYAHFEILIVENNSRAPETLALYRELQTRDARVRVVEHHLQPFNYSEINNYAVGLAAGSVLVFLNNDTCVHTPGWLEQMLSYAQRADVGAVGVRLYFPGMLIQHTGVLLGLGAGAGHFYVGYPADYPGYHHNLLLPRDLSAVTAACLMMRRAVFEEIGGFENEYRIDFGDVDLCLKVRRANYLVVCTPHAELIHYESMTRGYQDTREIKTRFENEANQLVKNWRAVLDAGDPYYNPNLTLSQGDYSIRAGVCPGQPRPMQVIHPVQPGERKQSDVVHE